MFGRSRPPIATSRKNTFANFALKNIILLAITFVIALLTGGYLAQNFGFILSPLASFLGAIYAPLNDPFFVSYAGIYALLSLATWFFRFKTGSRI